MTGNLRGFPRRCTESRGIGAATRAFGVIPAVARDSIRGMSTFVLIHGAWHAAWCWHKIVPRLEKAGHTVIAPDLPAMGRDRTPVNRVSLAKWRDTVCAVIDSVTEPVILVGHSRGGIVISEVAEHRPERVGVLVYVAAYLLDDGQCMFD